MKARKQPIEVSINGQLLEVKDRVVVVHVQDLNEIEGEAFITKKIYEAGAALVFYTDPSATIESLGDTDLERVGLKRIEKRT